MMILTYLLLIIAIVVAINYLPTKQPVKQKSAEAILYERYARGEISTQEYQAIKEKLNQ